jgi:mRNA interferase MazF
MNRVIRRGDVYWVPLEDEQGSGITHPHVVLQDDVITASRIRTVVVCALTTNITRATLPGNVLLEEGEANLPKQSVVVVSQVSTVDKMQFGEYIGSLSEERVTQIFEGMRFLQQMMEARKPVDDGGDAHV